MSWICSGCGERKRADAWQLRLKSVDRVMKLSSLIFSTNFERQRKSSQDGPMMWYTVRQSWPKKQAKHLRPRSICTTDAGPGQSFGKKRHRLARWPSD